MTPTPTSKRALSALLDAARQYHRSGLGTYGRSEAERRLREAAEAFGRADTGQPRLHRVGPWGSR